MIDQTAKGQDQLAELTADIVSAYVAHNALSSIDLPKLIADVYQGLNGLGTAQVEATVEAPKPAVPIRKSITPDFLICLDDGKRFKALKRHLAKLGMTPEQYRAKWQLPSDYPMVSANYAAVRSQLAKANGLGRKPEAPPPPSHRREEAERRLQLLRPDLHERPEVRLMFRKLVCVCVHTRDLGKSLQFYASMGLREAWRLNRATKDGVPWTLVGLDFPEAGGSQLVLSTDPDERPPEIEIRVEDVRQAYETLNAMPEVTWLAPPFPIEDGHVAVMTAPDGNVFVLIGR